MTRTLLATVALAVLSAGCGAPARHDEADAPPTVVSMARAEMTSVASSFEAGGIVRARATAAIASRIMAPVVEVHVRPGDRVRRGSPLVTLDAQEIVANRARAAAALESAVEAARAAESEAGAADAALRLARATHERIRSLQEQRSATAQELDQAVAALDGAVAQLDGARARTASAIAARQAAQSALDAAGIAASYADLTAPFDGIVADRSVDPGSMAAPGAPLLTVEDTSAFRLEVTLDEARAGDVAAGESAEVNTGDPSAPDRWTMSRVVEVARVDPASHSFIAKLDLPADPTMRSGLFGRARFSGPSRSALTVPASALVRRGQLAIVFTIDADNRARLQPVSPGPVARDRVEVLAGLREGDRVVISPPESLSDGGRVSGVGP